MFAQTIKTVGMIGLGKMGNPMARLLAAKGFSVVGYDVNAAAGKASAKHGVAIAASPAALAAKCDLVIVVTGFEAEAEDALFGKDGVVEGARSGMIIGVARPSRPQACVSWAGAFPRADSYRSTFRYAVESPRRKRENY